MRMQMECCKPSIVNERSEPYATPPTLVVRPGIGLVTPAQRLGSARLVERQVRVKKKKGNGRRESGVIHTKVITAPSRGWKRCYGAIYVDYSTASAPFRLLQLGQPGGFELAHPLGSAQLLIEGNLTRLTVDGPVLLHNTTLFLD